MSGLFEDSGSDMDIGLKTNNNYANNYSKWRQKEELNKLKTKYGEKALEFDESHSSSSSDTEDDGEEITAVLEKDFLKTLSRVKNKDPIIYDESVEFFEQVPSKTTKKSKNKNHPMYIKDYERKMLLEKSGQLSEAEEDEVQSGFPSDIVEQKQLKQNMKAALQNVNENEDEGWGGMFQIRQKTVEEHQKEEQDYKEWLLGNRDKIKDKTIESDLKCLKDYWSDPNLAEPEMFLRDYILQKRFLENEDENHIPTYEEIIHDSDDGLSEDEKAVDVQEEFEHKYNYRFEEPDQEFIKRYPRTMENSVRKEDDRRRIKRAETKERKQKDKQQKMEEIKQMQALKQKELKEKILKLKEITGITEMNFNNEDVDGDFDPAAHDKRMQKLFDDEFYQGGEDEQKPEFPEIDEELEIENWDHFDKETHNDTINDKDVYEPHCEDDDFNMNCDYDQNVAHKEIIESTKGKRKRKRKSNFAKTVDKSKPIFDPNDKTYQEYLDEFYKLDCEDIIGDIPCRFKYRKVVPNSFGLTIEEILFAKDRELNRWCSLKKAVQYRPENVEKYDVVAFDKKSKNDVLKKKVFPSLFSAEMPQTNQNQTKFMENTPCSENTSALVDAGDDIQSTGENDVLAKENGTKKKKKNETMNEKVLDHCATLPVESKPEEKMRKEKKKKKNKHKQIFESSSGTFTAQTNAANSHSASLQKVLKKIGGEVKGGKQKASRPSGSCKKVWQAKPKLGNQDSVDISNARLAAYGFKPKKFKNKIKYGHKNV